MTINKKTNKNNNKLNKKQKISKNVTKSRTISKSGNVNESNNKTLKNQKNKLNKKQKISKKKISKKNNKLNKKNNKLNKTKLTKKKKQYGGTYTIEGKFKKKNFINGDSIGYFKIKKNTGSSKNFGYRYYRHNEPLDIRISSIGKNKFNKFIENLFIENLPILTITKNGNIYTTNENNNWVNPEGNSSVNNLEYLDILKDLDNKSLYIKVLEEIVSNENIEKTLRSHCQILLLQLCNNNKKEFEDTLLLLIFDIYEIYITGREPINFDIYIERFERFENILENKKIIIFAEEDKELKLLDFSVKHNIIDIIIEVFQHLFKHMGDYFFKMIKSRPPILISSLKQRFVNFNNILKKLYEDIKEKKTEEQRKTTPNQKILKSLQQLETIINVKYEAYKYLIEQIIDSSDPRIIKQYFEQLKK